MYVHTVSMSVDVGAREIQHISPLVVDEVCHHLRWVQILTLFQF